MTVAVRREPAVPAGLGMMELVLALLGLLLVATPLIQRSLQPTQDSVARELRLQVAASGTYLLDGRPVSPDSLAAALRQAHNRTPDLRLRIAAADDSDYRALVGAMAVAERVGVRNIGSEMR